MAQLTIGQPPEPHLPASAEVPSARRVGLLVASMAYAAITLVVLWQQMRHLTSVPEHHDPLFSIWRLAWVAHQLPRHPAALFDGNMFYPELRTLAYSDAMLLPGLIAAPLIWAGVPAVVAYNLLLYASFVAAGAAMFLLVRSLTQDTASAWCAGLVFAFAPYRFDHYIHFELLWTFWMPLAFAALHQTLYRGRYRDAALTGIFVRMRKSFMRDLQQRSRTIAPDGATTLPARQKTTCTDGRTAVGVGTKSSSSRASRSFCWP